MNRIASLLSSPAIMLCLALGLIGCAEPKDDVHGTAKLEWKLRSVTLGMTPDQVERRLGKGRPYPRVGGYYVGTPDDADCSEYNASSSFLYFEVCFRNRVVVYTAVQGYAII